MKPVASNHRTDKVPASVEAANARLNTLFSGSWSVGDVVAFHTREKFLILAHDEATYRVLGPLVAQAVSIPSDQLQARYRQLFASALAVEPTRGSHTNVLQHLAGFFRDADPDVRRVVLEAVDAYRSGAMGLDDVRATVRAAAADGGIAFLVNSTYLDESEDGGRRTEDGGQRTED